MPSTKYRQALSRSHRRSGHCICALETIAEALAEGIYTGHPTMPAFQLDPDQIHDLLSYLKTLE